MKSIINYICYGLAFIGGILITCLFHTCYNIREPKMSNVDSIKIVNETIFVKIDSLRNEQINKVEEVKHYDDSATLELWYKLVK